MSNAFPCGLASPAKSVNTAARLTPASRADYPLLRRYASAVKPVPGVNCGLPKRVPVTVTFRAEAFSLLESATQLLFRLTPEPMPSPMVIHSP